MRPCPNSDLSRTAFASSFFNYNFFVSGRVPRTAPFLLRRARPDPRRRRHADDVDGRDGPAYEEQGRVRGLFVQRRRQSGLRLLSQARGSWVDGRFARRERHARHAGCLGCFGTGEWEHARGWFYLLNTTQTGKCGDKIEEAIQRLKCHLVFFPATFLTYLLTSREWSSVEWEKATFRRKKRVVQRVKVGSFDCVKSPVFRAVHSWFPSFRRSELSRNDEWWNEVWFV